MCQVNWPPHIPLPDSTAEPILLPVSEYGFVPPHASATELFACFWITKSFAWGAGKIYGFGWKLQNLAISARQKLAANFRVFGGIFDYSWWDLAQGFLHFYNEIHHHHHHHRYYYIIISLLLGKEKDFQHSSLQHYEGAHHLLFL